MKKILILTFYFGEAPWYLDYFIESCIANKDVDFIFFTDIKGITVKDENIKIINISFTEFKLEIANHFSFDLCIENPIKLCDIRPSFGEVFHDLIKDYDFWGYCDIDIIFGRIRSFLNDDILNNYDVIFAKHEYPSGFFALYRNKIEVNCLYRSSTDYIKVFQSSDLLLFDECGGHYDEVCSGVNILDTKYEIDSMHHILERNKSKVNILYKNLSIEGSHGHLRYEEGMLTYRDKFEVLLYHLTNFKKNFFFNKVNNTKLKNYNSYYIGKYKITKSNWFSILNNNLFCFIIFYLKYIFLKTDYYLNNIMFKSKISKRVSPGKYQYMKQILSVVFQNERCYIVHSDGNRNEIFFLRFSKNIIYVKDFKQFYLMDGLQNGYYTLISPIFNNHCLMIYKFLR